MTSSEDILLLPPPPPPTPLSSQGRRLHRGERGRGSMVFTHSAEHTYLPPVLPRHVLLLLVTFLPPPLLVPILFIVIPSSFYFPFASVSALVALLCPLTPPLSSSGLKMPHIFKCARSPLDSRLFVGTLRTVGLICRLRRSPRLRMIELLVIYSHRDLAV